MELKGNPRFPDATQVNVAEATRYKGAPKPVLAPEPDCCVVCDAGKYDGGTCFQCKTSYEKPLEKLLELRAAWHRDPAYYRMANLGQ